MLAESFLGAIKDLSPIILHIQAPLIYAVKSIILTRLYVRGLRVGQVMGVV